MNDNTVSMVRDDVYEEVAATFQCIEVMELDEALTDCGIEDVALRKSICERFAFGMGNFLDQYWFQAGGRRFYPLLCFTEKFLNTDTPVSELGTVYAPSPSFSFHEYASGDVEWYFGEGRQSEPLEMGLVGQENQ